MDKKELHDKIYSKIDELPTLPVVIPKLLSLIEDPKSSVSDAKEVISRDPALTSKLLKVANSAYYGFSQQIAELDMAIAILGFNMVKSLALSIGVMQSLPGTKASKLFSQEGLWLHSLTVASIIRKVSKDTGTTDKSDYIFIVGLLHDLGKIVLDQFFHDQFQEALEHTASHDNSKLHISEVNVIGIDHCEVASMLLKRWKFPELIISPIKFHHFTDLPEDINPIDVSLLRISNIIAQEQRPGEEGNSTPNEIHEKDLEILNIDQARLEEIRKFTAGITEEVKSFYSSIK